MLVLLSSLIPCSFSLQDNHTSLWLGLEGALESHNAASMANVSAMVEEHVQMNESIVQMGDPHGLDSLGHSQEVELTMEAMEVDVQVSHLKVISLLDVVTHLDFAIFFSDLRSHSEWWNQFHTYGQFYGSNWNEHRYR